MKKKAEHGAGDELEIIKAVAQAWHTRSGSWRPATTEFDAHRRSFQKNNPSRFKLEEATRLRAAARICGGGSSFWDFRQSLWDSYEIVSLVKKLELGLGSDTDLFGTVAGGPANAAARVHHHHRSKLESRNSLRNLFNRSSSRRFEEPP